MQLLKRPDSSARIVIVAQHHDRRTLGISGRVRAQWHVPIMELLHTSWMVTPPVWMIGENTDSLRVAGSVQSVR